MDTYFPFCFVEYTIIFFCYVRLCTFLNVYIFFFVLELFMIHIIDVSQGYCIYQIKTHQIVINDVSYTCYIMRL